MRIKITNDLPLEEERRKRANEKKTLYQIDDGKRV